jgi:SHS2 domain-containing protein
MGMSIATRAVRARAHHFVVAPPVARRGVTRDSGAVVMGRYRVLEDVAVADCALDIHGRDLADVFETAAAALVDLMVDPATIEISEHVGVSLDAEALDLLLFDWLSELIYLKDRDRRVFPRIRLRVHGSGPFHLTASLDGGVIDPERTARRADPKAVTFHQFALEPDDGGWRARVVIDI